MKDTKMMALLASASIGLMGASALAAPLTYTAGDLLLGVRASGGTGADKDYVVNLGQASTFTGATGSITVSGLGSIKADLAATFGNDWNYRSDVFWSVSGANSAAPTGTVAGEPVRTIFVSKAQTTPGILNGSPWQRSTSSSQAAPAGKIIDMATYFAYVNGQVDNPATPLVNEAVVAESTANSTKARVQNKSDINSFASYMPGGTVTNAGGSGISYAYFAPTIEGSFGNAGLGVLELYKLNPGTTGPGTLVGTFSLDDAGTVTFHPANTTATGDATVQFENLTGVTVNENIGNAVLTLIRGGNLSTTVTVNVTQNPGTATAGIDYTSTPSSVTFGPNETSKTVSIPIKSRSGVQTNRSFTASYTVISGTVAAGDNNTTVTISDTALVPSGTVAFGAATYTIAPQNGNGTLGSASTFKSSLQVTLNRTVSTYGPITIPIAAGTFLPAGFSASVTAPTSVTFANGQTSTTLTIPVTLNAGNTAVANSFKLTLGTPTSAAVIKGSVNTAMVNILKVDTLAPSTTVTTTPAVIPANGLLTSLAGAVADTGGAGVFKLEYSLNGAAYSNVTLTGANGDASRNYSIAFVQLLNGANTVLLRATDMVGNFSVTTKTYTVNDTATFGAPGTPSVAGNYVGLLTPDTGDESVDTIGAITVSVTSLGKFTGKVTLSGVVVPITGTFQSTGPARFGVGLTSTFNLVERGEVPVNLGALALSINPTTKVITGTLTGSALIANVSASRTLDIATAPTTDAVLLEILRGTPDGSVAGNMTGYFSVPVSAPTELKGNGVVTITVSTKGAVSLKGYLADGQVVSAAVQMTADHKAPLFGQLYKKLGAIGGVLVFNSSETDSDAKGTFKWIRPANSRAAYFPAGWPTGLDTELKAAIYTPTAATAIVGLGGGNATTPNADLNFTDGLTTTVNKDVFITLTNTATSVTAVSKNVPIADTSFSLTIAGGTGGLSGTFTHDAAGILTPKTAFKAVLFNKNSPAVGYGYFLSPAPEGYGLSGQGGLVTLDTIP